MEQRGTLRNWNDAKGFGFIRPDGGGAEVFAHISVMRGARRPQAGDRVLFVPERAGGERPKAAHVRLDAGLALDDETIRQRPAPAETSRRLLTDTVRQWPLKLVLWLGLCLLPAWGSWQLAVALAADWLLLVYPLASLLAFGAYALDKSRALNDGWRTRESSLHMLELLGGWPGALLAQQLFRHKTRKWSFQLVCGSIILLHQVFWLDRLLLDGHYLGSLAAALVQQ